MKTPIILIILLFVISLALYPQHIILRNKKNFKTENFYKGDIITYKLKDFPEEWKTTKIVSIHNTFFICTDDIVSLNKVSAIQITRKSLNYKADGTLLIIGGLFFPSISLINDLINNETHHFTKSQLTVYSTLVATGLILRQFSLKNCIIGKKYSLEIIQ